ncbi:MAG: hypothetical protein LBQ92_00700 [Propionibacteriaceae bacterium]|jgi:hypothetical protein|nr:hypothetical protein [Propionibacteriaceae bacterium]
MTVAYQLAAPLVPLRIGENHIQLGLRDPIVLERVPDELAEAVLALHRPQTRQALRNRLPGLPARWIDYLLETLDENRLLRRMRQRLDVLVVGSSDAARHLTNLLNSEHPGRARWAGQGSEDDLLPSRCLRQLGAPWPALTVLAANTAEPDRTFTDELCAGGHDHLVVRIGPGSAVIGPLVLAGQTACLRCHDLAQARLDRRWPLALAKLCHTRVPAESGLRDWAVAVTHSQVHGYLAGRLPDAINRTLQLDIGDYAIFSEDIAVHPACPFHTLGAKP